MSAVTPSSGPGSARALVVGAGISGLSAASELAALGAEVVVLEKARGAGGRTSTRREGELRFDHGAQYFTARDGRFRRAVESWRERGVVAPWAGRLVRLEAGAEEPAGQGETRWVGVPGMNAVARSLAEPLEVRYGARVAGLERTPGGWSSTLADGSTTAGFDLVVVSAPAAQTAELLATAAPRLSAGAAAAPMSPCWAVMAAFDDALPLDWDGAFVAGSALSWIARNGSKPGRPVAESWVLHAGPEWSEQHLDLPPDEAAAALLGAFRTATGLREASPVHLAAHRWRFALPSIPLAARCLVDRDLGIAACGDWCGGSRVEDAYLSGITAAQSLLEARQRGDSASPLPG